MDKGANEPNKFLDPKSSESMLPAWSNGRRDDLMQMQYLRAMIGYWRDAANNPLSEVYAGPMVDMDRAHVWAFDSRPFPQFPANTAIWSDGDNYARGHWISGRTMAQPLSSVVAEICADAGLTDIDVSGLYGIVRGYSVADNGTARAALQPLMLAYGFEALERGGKLVFRMRDGRVDATIGPDQLAVSEEGTGFVETARAMEAETAGRVRLNFVEAEGDYEARSVEAIFPDEATTGVAQSELTLALTRAEGQRIVERWLTEARVARDGARLSLPPSLGYLGAGDVVTIEERPNSAYRIDRVEQAGALAIEAVRVEAAVFEPSDETEERVIPRSFTAPVPVHAVFLDLPLMSGEEVPHAPHLAVTATPWPGSVAVYASDQDAGYQLKQLVAGRATIGETLATLDAAQAGVWDRGPALRVRLASGTLSSVSSEQLLNGANVMAIGNGTSANWELFQFRTATLVAPDTWDLSLRLRGQAGTDAVMPASWPAGSTVVLMDSVPKQLDLALAARDLARHYRIGPAGRIYSDPSYSHSVEAFSGIGLRPLSVCHLRARRDAAGNFAVGWVRRTRMDGDNWSAVEVPLGELRERYLLRVVKGTAIAREVTVGPGDWSYPVADQAADTTLGQLFEIHVAQLSDAFGAGPFARITVND
ncbi:MAG: phage tail protein [Paracoccaceae bacterium]